MASTGSFGRGVDHPAGKAAVAGVFRAEARVAVPGAPPQDPRGIGGDQAERFLGKRIHLLAVYLQDVVGPGGPEAVP